MSRGHNRTQKAKRDVMMTLDEELMKLPEQERNLRVYDLKRAGKIVEKSKWTSRGKSVQNSDAGGTLRLRT